MTEIKENGVLDRARGRRTRSIVIGLAVCIGGYVLGSTDCSPRPAPQEVSSATPGTVLAEAKAAGHALVELTAAARRADKLTSEHATNEIAQLARYAVRQLRDLAADGNLRANALLTILKQETDR